MNIPDRLIADHAEFPIKTIERWIFTRSMRIYLGRPGGRVFPLRVGQQVSFDTWPSWKRVCLGGAVGEGWVEIRDVDFVLAEYWPGSSRDDTLPTVLIRPQQPDSGPPRL